MRKKFLIKPSIQLRHLFWTLGVVLVSCVAGYFLFEGMVSSAIMKGVMSEKDWLVAKDILRLGFLVVLVILLSAIGIENYLLFHRFIGPLYALEKGLKKLASGDLNSVTTIRDYDELKDLIAAFEEMKKEVRNRLSAHERTSELLSKELDRVLSNASPQTIDALRARLKEIHDDGEQKAA